MYTGIILIKPFHGVKAFENERRITLTVYACPTAIVVVLAVARYVLEGYCCSISYLDIDV